MEAEAEAGRAAQGGGRAGAGAGAGGSRAPRGGKLARVADRMDGGAWAALRARPSPLRFGKSRVHAWGMFAARPIAAEEFLVEYVGQTIRSELTDAREAGYEARGMDSSYLFRIDRTLVIDATVMARPASMPRAFHACCIHVLGRAHVLAAGAGLKRAQHREAAAFVQSGWGAAEPPNDRPLARACQAGEPAERAAASCAGGPDAAGSACLERGRLQSSAAGRALRVRRPGRSRGVCAARRVGHATSLTSR